MRAALLLSALLILTGCDQLGKEAQAQALAAKCYESDYKDCD